MNIALVSLILLVILFASSLFVLIRIKVTFSRYLTELDNRFTRLEMQHDHLEKVVRIVDENIEKAIMNVDDHIKTELAMVRGDQFLDFSAQQAERYRKLNLISSSEEETFQKMLRSLRLDNMKSQAD